jgi:hypothetical protein
MLKELTLLGVLALASGCAHQTRENRVVVSGSSSPYVTDSNYRTTYGYSYGTYAPTEYDNSSKGAGARAMMQNPYAERTYRTYGYDRYYTTPTGTQSNVYGREYGLYGPTEYDNTSKGAGARAMMQNPHEERTYTYGAVKTAPAGGAVSTGETDTSDTSKGAGARSITGSDKE